MLKLIPYKLKMLIVSEWLDSSARSGIFLCKRIKYGKNGNLVRYDPMPKRFFMFEDNK